VNEPQTEKKCATADQHGTDNPVHVEVDSRIYMAADRTFLAWIRTGIALMGFGFVVARFGLFLRELTLAGTHQQMTSTGFSLPIGIGLIGFGIVVNFVSVIRHRRYIAAIDRNDFRSAFGSTFAIWVALLLAISGLAMTLYLIRLTG
jgi:putative membrane protein